MTSRNMWMPIWLGLVLVDLMPLLRARVGAADPESSYGDLLLLAVLVAGCRKYWKERPSTAVRLRPAGVIALIASGLFQSAGAAMANPKWYAVGSAGMISGLVLTVSGLRGLQHWLPVLLFSFTLIGPPDELRAWFSLKLQLESTRLAAMLASPLIPITTRGNVFYIHGAPFEVGETCSGISMWEGLIFTVLFWQLFWKVPLQRLLVLLVCACLLPAPLNALRLWITALVAHWHSKDTAIAVHTDLEYVIFPLGMLSLWLIGRVRHGKR